LFSASKQLKYYLILPSIIFLLVMVIVPLLYTIILTFCNYDLTKPQQGIVFVGVNNYVALFSNTRFWYALFRSVYYVGFSIGVSFVIGFGVTLLLGGTVRFKSFYATALLIPMIMTPVIIGLGFRFMYHPDFGILPYLFSLLGIKNIDLLGNSQWALISIILTDIWQWTPFVIAVLYAGLGYLSREPFEAARIDGASHFQVLRYITIPLMRIPIATVLVIRSMDAMRAFDKIFMMTRGGPGLATETLSIYSWRVAFAWFKMGDASTMGILMLLIIIAISNILVSIITKG